MTKDEALKLALEALGKIADVNAMDYEYRRWAREAYLAIKEALAQPEQEPVAKEKIHALEPMIEALRIKQTVTFSESQSLFAEVAQKTGMLPPPFELSGNQWCALVNLTVARFGDRANGIKGEA